MHIKTVQSEDQTNTQLITSIIHPIKREYFIQKNLKQFPKSVLHNRNQSFNHFNRRKYKSQIITNQHHAQSESKISHKQNKPFQLLIQPNCQRTEKFQWLLQAEEIQQQKFNQIKFKLNGLGFKNKKLGRLANFKESIKHCMVNIQSKQNNESVLRKQQLHTKKSQIVQNKYNLPRIVTQNKKNNMNLDEFDIKQGNLQKETNLFHMQFKNNEMKPVLVDLVQNQRKFIKINRKIKKSFHVLESILSKDKLEKRQNKLNSFFNLNN